MQSFLRTLLRHGLAISIICCCIILYYRATFFLTPETEIDDTDWVVNTLDTVYPTTTDGMTAAERVGLAKEVAAAVLQEHQERLRRPGQRIQLYQGEKLLELPSRFVVPRASANLPPKLFYFLTIDCNHDVFVAQANIKYYLEMGLEPDHMHVLLNLAPGRAAHASSCLRLVNKVGVYFSYWPELFVIARKHELGIFAEIAMGVRPTIDWVMHLDVDDFHEFPSGGILNTLKEALRFNISLVTGRFVDRVAQNGALAQISHYFSMMTQFPLACNLTKVIGQAETDKMMLWRAIIYSEDGGWHHTNPSDSTIWGLRVIGPYRVHHFKWTSGLYEYLKEREQLRLNLKQFSWINQTSSYLRHLDANNGHFNVQDPSLGCMPVRDLPPLENIDVMIKKGFIRILTPSGLFQPARFA